MGVYGKLRAAFRRATTQPADKTWRCQTRARHFDAMEYERARGDKSCGGKTARILSHREYERFIIDARPGDRANFSIKQFSSADASLELHIRPIKRREGAQLPRGEKMKYSCTTASLYAAYKYSCHIQRQGAGYSGCIHGG